VTTHVTIRSPSRFRDCIVARWAACACHVVRRGDEGHLMAILPVAAAVFIAGPTTEALEEAVSLLQHHDAITGTEKQHVACDYHRRLHRGGCRCCAVGAQQCAGLRLSWPADMCSTQSCELSRAGLKYAQAVVTSALEALIRGQDRPGRDTGGVAPDSITLDSSTGSDAYVAASQRVLQEQPNPIDAPITLEICDWLNITACNTTGLSRCNASCEWAGSPTSCSAASKVTATHALQCTCHLLERASWSRLTTRWDGAERCRCGRQCPVARPVPGL
jgi:hypothetical protein